MKIVFLNVKKPPSKDAGIRKTLGSKIIWTKFWDLKAISLYILQFTNTCATSLGTLDKQWSFPFKDFFTKCDHIGRKLKKKSLMENLIFCPVGTFIFSVSNQLFPVSFLIFLQVLAKIIQGKSRSVLVL